MNIHCKDWNTFSRSWNTNILVTWCQELTHWKRPWCWERLTAGGEGDNRTRWLDVITDSMDMSLSKLREMESQRVRHVEWLTTAIVFVNRGFSLASNKIVTTRQMRINSEIKLWFPKGKPTSISVTLICMQSFKIPQLVCPYVKMCYLLLEDWITM